MPQKGCRLLHEVAGDCEFVLLGSVATVKYLEPMFRVFGDRLLFPREFVGRGDMSRGGLMLRCASAGEELEYVPAGRTRTSRSAPAETAPKGCRREMRCLSRPSPWNGNCGSL